MVPEAYPPSPLVTSHSCLTNSSAFVAGSIVHGRRTLQSSVSRAIRSLPGHGDEGHGRFARNVPAGIGFYRTSAAAAVTNVLARPKHLPAPVRRRGEQRQRRRAKPEF